MGTPCELSFPTSSLRQQTQSATCLQVKMEFPQAGACAELMLADKKDALYEGEVKNLLRDLLERCCGPHLLSQLLPELTSASALLYYLLVLGRKRPQQTLGEEYCDVMRVVVDATKEPGANVVKNVAFPRHLAWLALAVVPSYLVARSKSGWMNLSQLAMTPRERMAAQLRQRQAAGANSTTAPIDEGISRRVLASFDRLSAQLKDASTRLEEKLVPEGYEFALPAVQNWLSQMHLASFYVSAKFLHFALRLTRVEYIFIRKDLRPALNLSLLGYLMFMRLCTTAIMELKRVRKLHAAEAKKKLGTPGGASHSSYTRVPSLSAETIASSEASSGRKLKKCALCLGERVSPATTPCGHVFCWECIVGWCQKNKPECPICRQEAHPQQIKCIYNYC